MEQLSTVPAVLVTLALAVVVIVGRRSLVADGRGVLAVAGPTIAVATCLAATSAPVRVIMDQKVLTLASLATALLVS